MKIVQGGATGADTLARLWAEENNVSCVTMHADWKREGRLAGIKRNQAMIDQHKPDMVLQFPGGKGTADMVKRARKSDIPVVKPLYDRFIGR